MRWFRAFVELFNNFVASLNDGKFDTQLGSACASAGQDRKWTK